MKRTCLMWVTFAHSQHNQVGVYHTPGLHPVRDLCVSLPGLLVVAAAAFSFFSCST